MVVCLNKVDISSASQWVEDVLSESKEIAKDDLIGVSRKTSSRTL